MAVIGHARNSAANNRHEGNRTYSAIPSSRLQVAIQSPASLVHRELAWTSNGDTKNPAQSIVAIWPDLEPQSSGTLRMEGSIRTAPLLKQ